MGLAQIRKIGLGARENPSVLQKRNEGNQRQDGQNHASKSEAKRRGYSLADLLTEESFKKLSNKLVFSSVNEMMASVGYGAVSVNQVICKLIDYYKKEVPKPAEVLSNDKIRKPASTVEIKGMSGLLVRFAHCCNPVPRRRYRRLRVAR